MSTDHVCLYRGFTMCCCIFIDVPRQKMCLIGWNLASPWPLHFDPIGCGTSRLQCRVKGSSRRLCHGSGRPAHLQAAGSKLLVSFQLLRKLQSCCALTTLSKCRLCRDQVPGLCFDRGSATGSVPPHRSRDGGASDRAGRQSTDRFIIAEPQRPKG